MPTIIDSLIVRLGLDAKPLDSSAPAATRKLKDLEGQTGETEKQVRKLNTTSKEGGASIGELTGALGKFLALLGSTLALKQFVMDQIESNAQLDRFSKNLGLSVSTISAWGNAAEELGGSAKSVQGTMDMLSKSQTELRLTGQSSLIPYLSALGVSLATVDGKAKPVDQILLDLSERFSHMDRTTANNMGRMMGIDQDTMNLLLQGRHEVELTIKRQKEYGAVSKEQAAEASKLQHSIVDLKQGYTALGRNLLQQASPALEKILGLLSSLGNWARSNSEFVGDFLKVVGVGLAAIGIAALPIDGVVVAVAALATGITLLWQDYQTWKRGGDSLIDWSKWKVGIDAAIAGIDALKNAIKSIPTFADKARGWADKLPGGHAANAASDAVANWVDRKVGIPTTGAGGGVTPTQARAQAQRVSAKTGISADIIFAQWEHETGGFKNRGATSLNNLAGVNVPGGKGQDYRNFKTLDDFGDYYAHLMRPDGRYGAARNAKTPEDFAHTLKAGGYYGDTEEHYAKDMRRYFNGIPGASGTIAQASAYPAQTAGSSRTTTVTTGDIKVYTAATDAQGIVGDMGKSMDFLFTSQANAGLM